MLALVTATRNSINTLPASLVSVSPFRTRLKQIFVDGASTDGTQEYLQRLAEKSDNILVHAQQGTGLYQALNQGVRLAIGDPEIEYVGMLHSDDRLIAEGFSKFLTCIEREQADVYYSDIQFHNAFGEVVRVWDSGDFSKFKLNTGWMPPHASMIVAKSVYREVGLYDPDYGTAADYEWVVRVLSARVESVVYFSKRTLSMLVGGASSESVSARLRANAMDGRVWADRSRWQSLMIRLLKPTRKIGQFLKKTKRL